MKKFLKSYKLMHVNGLFIVLNSKNQFQYRFGNLDKDIPIELHEAAKKMAHKYNLQY